MAVNLTEAVTEAREAIARGNTCRSDGDEEGVRVEFLNLAEAFAQIDGALSDVFTEGLLPKQWRSAVPFRVPEGVLVTAHQSKTHPGLNVEIEAPEELRVTVHVNEWLAVDTVIGSDHNDGHPLPSSGGPS